MGKISKTIVSLSPLSFIWLLIGNTDYHDGMKAMEKGRYDDAIECFNKMVEPFNNKEGKIEDRYVLSSYLELAKFYLYVDSNDFSEEKIKKIREYLYKASNTDHHQEDIGSQASLLKEVLDRKSEDVHIKK